MRSQRCQILWRCRRGMRELDLMLEAYVGSRYDDAMESERQAFLQLLDLPNDRLIGYLIGLVRPEEGPARRIVEQIRSQPPY